MLTLQTSHLLWVATLSPWPVFPPRNLVDEERMTPFSDGQRQKVAASARRGVAGGP